MDSPPHREAAQFSVTSPARPSMTRQPSLLPAFEPLSSSPLPRPSKRKYAEHAELPKAQLKYYPTPVPTSSTGMLPSSPPARPALERTMSTLSERTPLSALPTIDLPLDGEPVLMGRSSNSSHHQLSASRLISRVHVRASYIAPSASHTSGEVVIECLGWNGCKVHCRSQVYQLAKGDTFSSDKPSVEIMLDVQDARVLIAWPFGERQASVVSTRSELTQIEDMSPSRRAAGKGRYASSPPLMNPRSSPSLSPIRQPAFTELGTFIAADEEENVDHNAVQVYEDRASAEPVAAADDTADSSQLSQTYPDPSQDVSRTSQASSLSSLASDDFSDRDEENDPIIHSFYNAGDNLLPRMSSITASSSILKSPEQPPPQRRRKPLRAASPHLKSIPESLSRQLNDSPIKNHVINQLAFSRLHSQPLSTILGNLPAEMKGERSLADSAATLTEKTFTQPDDATLTGAELKRILDSIPCVGEISREGKDAAGKPLENEFYYIPEIDADEMRRETVVNSMGRTSIRAARKQHKQYYWKKPRH
ncbi:hypothetical protein W97_02906 [Coniosporium apollinis CBS 100218]|uniref:FHA domain-containing protein n=1 Tax=Coniosporium apollinis (strain CBS 100218) TaxID=1168221 RepID=R7YPA8_CONA1|nr:uncharacterized protein W97_02906 [Coniosporium apollinis CBS 100218]EON63678.1 hypothetical protein W97_02906 [Coniosporium apollinis CBS 100218]